GALPGEGFAEQLDAEITGDQERALVLEVDLRAEALLVLGIVDPAGLPGVVGCPVQVAEDLGAADGTAALGLVGGVLEPEHAGAVTGAAGLDVERAVPRVVAPHPGAVGAARLPGAGARHEQRRHKEREKSAEPAQRRVWGAQRGTPAAGRPGRERAQP